MSTITANVTRNTLSSLRLSLISQRQQSWSNGLSELIFSILTDERKENCGDNEKLKNDLINMNKVIVSTEIKAYLIQTIAGIYGSKPVTYQQQKEWLDEFNEYLILYAKLLSRNLENLQFGYFRFCDEKYDYWIKDVSSFELHEVIRERVFLSYRSGCQSTCNEVWHHDVCRMFEPRAITCDGNLTNISEIDVRNVCASRGDESKRGWILGANGSYYQQPKLPCPKNEAFPLLLEEQFSNFTFNGCRGACFKKKWRVYLGHMRSRELENYVIVGMRFIVRDHWLFLQPAEGLLGSDGNISNVSWIPLPQINPKRKSVQVDMMWHSFFLDDLQLKPGYVVTGIKFNAEKRGTKDMIKGFAISIRGRLLDSTGKLNLSCEYNIARSPQNFPLEELPLTPMRPSADEILRRQRPSPEGYTYVKLQQSDFLTDAGQSTLPLFDGTSVIMQQPSALSGIGIFHKRSGGHAGFISLRLYPKSKVPYLNDLIKAYETERTKPSGSEHVESIDAAFVLYLIDYFSQYF